MISAEILWWYNPQRESICHDIKAQFWDLASRGGFTARDALGGEVHPHDHVREKVRQSRELLFRRTRILSNDQSLVSTTCDARVIRDSFSLLSLTGATAFRPRDLQLGCSGYSAPTH